MGLFKIAAWLVAAIVGLFLIYIAFVSGAVMVMGVFTGSGELAGGGFAGLVCALVLIVAPVAWHISRRKKRRASEEKSMQFGSELYD